MKTKKNKSRKNFKKQPSKLKYLQILEIVKKLKGKHFSNLIDHLSDQSVDHVCECIYNVINTDIGLTKKTKIKLKKHIKDNLSHKHLKKISNKNTPIFKRRTYLKQEGRGLPMLLAAAIPFLSNLIFGK